MYALANAKPGLHKCHRASFVWLACSVVDAITGWSKKACHKVSVVTSSNIDRCSYFFHYYTRQSICNTVVNWLLNMSCLMSLQFCARFFLWSLPFHWLVVLCSALLQYFTIFLVIFRSFTASKNKTAKSDDTSVMLHEHMICRVTAFRCYCR